MHILCLSHDEYAQESKGAILCLPYVNLNVFLSAGKESCAWNCLSSARSGPPILSSDSFRLLHDVNFSTTHPCRLSQKCLARDISLLEAFTFSPSFT